ncbi:MAG: hypothetical protein JXA24_02630 [Proteobacteria bacterium]|nr:hypothetical protein [Pseudomonadota bacterium]
MTVPRVSISDSGCSIAEGDLKAIRRDASRAIARGIALGFGEFPIDRASYGRGALGLFKERHLCSVITADSGATSANHNALRKRYRAEALTEAEAQRRGVVARQIPVRRSCPPDFDWCESMAYNDVTDCREVLEEIDGFGMPTVLYAVDGDAAEAQGYVNDLSTAPLYTKYSNAGPRACASGRDEAGRRYTESYHSLAVLFTSVRFAMRIFSGRGWTAWTLRRSCDGPNGRTLAADDLMFNFGMRVFVPVEVDDGGDVSRRALVMTASAAAANGGLASLVPGPLLRKTGYERFVGAEYAKKILLDSFARGWEIAD